MSRKYPNCTSAAVSGMALLLCRLLLACNQYGVPQDQSGSFAACCGGLGVCVASGLVAPDALRGLSRDRCRTDLVCAPRELLVRGPGAPPRCSVSATGAEGRCLPACLPAVASQPGLRQDGCSAGQLCAPCYDPLNGAATSACQLGADPGPSEPAVVFEACCGTLGRCVPGELVDEDDRPRLERAECQAEQALCAPLELARDRSWQPQPCHEAVSGTEGRCLPACLPEVARRASKLSRGVCASDHLCAPCFDPATGQDTGACALGADPGPSQAPVVFGTCCGELGRCVPNAWIEADDRPQLSRLECSSTEELCVPEPLARDERAQVQHCTVAGTRAEGRCLPACLPPVAARATQLAADGCEAGQLCTPCFDPLDGDGTGACELGGDRGATQPPVTFASCAGGVGKCVPSTLVEASDQPRLARESCADADALCVPTALARDPLFKFASCNTNAADSEGRCLPAFLPEVAARAKQLSQDSCRSGQLCAPCYDPLTGEATAACNLGGDPGPARAPTPYPHCCSDAGRCIVSSQVPAASRSQLNADGCDAQAGLLCVPLTLAQAPDAPPAACHDSATSAEGRCLMQCLPEVAPQASRLRPSGCAGGELCVPCYDPLTGDSTGACSFSAADPGPSEPAVVFDACCAGGGLCVPQALLPGGSSSLSAQSCTRAGSVCAPRALVAEANGRLPGCASVLGTSVCVASCFVPFGLGEVLPASSCAEAEECVPCWAASGLCP